MIGAVARKLFGSSNDRRIRAYRPRVEEINALENELRSAVRRGAARPHRRVQEAARRRARRSTTSWCRPSPPCARPAKRTLGQRHFDVQMIGGMVLHEGKICRDEDRRRQDAGRHAAGLSQRARRPRRPRRHRQRLPRQARRRMDGADLQVPRPDRRRHRARPRRRASARSNTTATSPTAPTTSSASTICATI